MITRIAQSVLESEVAERDEDWPSLSEVVRYRDRVRERVLDLYQELGSGKRMLTRRLARALAMVLEHNAFHIEVRGYRDLPEPVLMTGNQTTIS